MASNIDLQTSKKDNEVIDNRFVLSVNIALDFFKKIFIFFWITSLIGHYWEVLWAIFKNKLLGQPYWGPTDVTLIPVAAPYGIGVIAIIVFIIPLIKKYKLNPAFVFILNFFIVGLIEYLCSQFLILVFGENRFWNYSNDFLNIGGHICLVNTFAFGVISTMYVYILHPVLDAFLNKLSRRYYNGFFWAIFSTYIFDMSYAFLR